MTSIDKDGIYHVPTAASKRYNVRKINNAIRKGRKAAIVFYGNYYQRILKVRSKKGVIQVKRSNIRNWTTVEETASIYVEAE